MLEFHRDQQRHHHAENRLKDRMIQRIERPRQRQRYDRPNQLPQRYDDDHRDHDAQDVGDDLLEALVEGQHAPLQPIFVELHANLGWLAHGWGRRETRARSDAGIA